MALDTSATLSVDTVFSQQETDSNSVDTRTGSVSYSQSLTSGTGSLNINAVYNLQDHSIGSGSGLSVDFRSLTQPIVGGSMSISFNNIKSIVINNASTTVGEDISIRATGSTPLTGPFNGGSGNVLVKPASSYIYSDPYTGLSVSSGSKDLQITNEGTGPISITLVAVVVSGS